MGQSPISKMLRHLFLEMFGLSLTAPLSANERIAEFLDFAIQAKFAYVNKLRARNARPYNVVKKAGAAEQLLLFAYFNTTFFAPSISERVSTNSCVGETKRFCGARSFAPVLSM